MLRYRTAQGKNEARRGFQGVVATLAERRKPMRRARLVAFIGAFMKTFIDAQNRPRRMNAESDQNSDDPAVLSVAGEGASERFQGCAVTHGSTRIPP